MEKEGVILNSEDIVFLNQLISSLEEAEMKLEMAFQNKNHQQFTQLKKFILQIQKKINEIIK